VLCSAISRPFLEFSGLQAQHTALQICANVNKDGGLRKIYVKTRVVIKLFKNAEDFFTPKKIKPQLKKVRTNDTSKVKASFLTGEYFKNSWKNKSK